MELLVNVFLILLGVSLVLWGADRLTEGASSIARRMRIPEIVIGLTIVAAGTSAPELFVSIASALKGSPDMALGNVVGSNTMNALLIVGAAALAAPMVISPSTVRKDIPFALGAAALLVLLCLDDFSTLDLRGHQLSRFDGVLLLVGFAVFMAYTLRTARKGAHDAAPSGETSPVWRGLLWVAVGLACLVFGSDVFVSSASAVAAHFGISEGVIGLTVVAGGTSLPELATSVVAARKGQSAMAIGNVIGSNVFNILLILALTAVISPMQIAGITIVDLSVMLLATLLVLFFSFTRYTIERWEGVLLLVIYLVYLSWLIHGL